VSHRRLGLYGSVICGDISEHRVFTPIAPTDQPDVRLAPQIEMGPEVAYYRAGRLVALLSDPWLSRISSVHQAFMQRHEQVRPALGKTTYVSISYI
jgi:hypothetical protein